MLKAKFARLLEGGEGFVYARDSEFVGLDVEVADCVVDELIESVDVQKMKISGSRTVAGSSSRSIFATWVGKRRT